jgi:bacteriocin biosynthesis cyclodehydratase domain-containing protein
MALNPTSKKLRALPLQVVEIAGGVILKRGCTEVKISGEGAAQALQVVLGATAGRGATSDEICRRFAAPHRPAVEHLIEQLVSRRLLVPSDDMESALGARESSLEIFYWHFGEPAARVTERLDSRQLVILGVNCISRQLTAALSASGLRNFQVVDDPLLRNLRLFDDAGHVIEGEWPALSRPPLALEEWADGADLQSLGCLVATSDFGGQQSMRQWNRFCVEHHRHFLPVVLQNLIGYIGPLVIPGETACFECLRARQDAHLEDPQTQRAVEGIAFEEQVAVGFHPSMASVLGDVAAFELAKLYSGVLPRWNVGTLIEVNLLTPRLAARKVLKIPRCAVCSPLNTRPSTAPKRNLLPPGTWVGT